MRRLFDDIDDMMEHECPAGAFDDPGIMEYAPRMRQWMLRLLVDCGAVHDKDFDIERFAEEAHALLPVHHPQPGKGDLVGRYRKLRKAMAESPAEVRGTLAENIARLGVELKLSDLESDLVAFAVLYTICEPFKRLVDTAFPSTDSGRVPRQLGQMLGHSWEDIEDALSAEGCLVEAGLLRFEEHLVGRPLASVLDFNRRILIALARRGFCVERLLGHAARPAVAPKLELADYRYMSAQRDLVVRYLKAVRARPAHGVSVLLDGPPGVGKSEFARLVARETGFRAHEITEVDLDGDPAMAIERNQALRLAQRLLARNADAMIIFDEADGFLAEPGVRSSSRGLGAKAMLTRLLETLQVPVIWITNEADLVNPAVLRRMDLTVRFERPPPSVCSELMTRALGQDGVGLNDWVERVAQERVVTPARIDQAARVTRRIAENEGGAPGEVFRTVLEENLQLGKRKGQSGRDASVVLPYRPELTRASEDLQALASDLARHPHARICLYGPPGTGKTRYVKHLAEQVGLGVAEYRASDLLDMFVGNMEKNIREMFDGHADGKHLVLLDEADTLFANRRGANQRWEVSQVNELLKGLEQFEGLFVASTNLMDSLDEAVLRRLDLKIRFDWLDRPGRWRLFLDLARAACVTVRGEGARQARLLVDDLDYLTPGDFAVVARRLDLRNDVRTGVELAELLQREMRLKPEARGNASIGFTASVR